MKNKKIIYLLVAIVVLIILAILYSKSLNTTNSNNSDTTEATTDIISSEKQIQMSSIDNVSKLSIKNNVGEYTIELNDNKYTILNYEKNTFSQSNLKQMFQVVSDLYSTQIVDENSTNLSQYGLETPKSTITITGSTNEMLYIGNNTPDNKYTYASLSSAPTKVYMINKSYGELFTKGIKDLMDFSIGAISATNVNYVDIKQKDKPEIIIKTDENNEVLKNYVSTSGLSAFIMESPIKDAIVYPSNMQESLLCDLSTFSISDVPELSLDNIAKYGLDNPYLDITLKTEKDSVNFKVSNVFDGKTMYFTINDRPEIYATLKDNFNAFENADIMDFTQNFINLYPRSTVDSIEIKSSKYNHNIIFKSEGDNKIATDSDGVKRDNRNMYIDNKIIDSSIVGDFYEMLVGIGFDSVLFDNNIKSSTPDMTITFNLLDGTKTTTQLYNYNDNFYYIKESGDNTILLVNKQQLSQLENKIIDITK